MFYLVYRLFSERKVHGHLFPRRRLEGHGRGADGHHHLGNSHRRQEEVLPRRDAFNLVRSLYSRGLTPLQGKDIGNGCLIIKERLIQ
jgi:hypothetical protein